MFKRPVVFIVLSCAVLIILLKPVLFNQQEIPVNNRNQEISITSNISNAFLSVIKNTTPMPYDSLLGSVVFGSSFSPLDHNLKERFKKVGLSHILVASGTQVSILIGVCLAVVRAFKIPINIAVIPLSFINIIFALIAGAGPSILRSSIMGEIVILGLLFNRDAEIYSSLAISALLLMIFNPLVIFDIGFQLSFAATFALVYVCPVLEERGIPTIAAVSFSPIITTLPIVLFNFNQVPVLALPANMLIVPWIEMLTVIGFASTVFGAVFLPIAEVLNGFLLWVLIWLKNIVYFMSDLPFSSVHIKSPPFITLIFYYFVLIYIVEMLKAKKKITFNKQHILILALLFALAVIWSSALAPASAKNGLQISIIDVKQGDSIFIKSPKGISMLIDAGGKYKNFDAGRKYVLPFLRKEGINKLDILVLTHPHNDHLGGMAGILEEMPIGLILDSGQAHTSKAYLEFLELIDKKKIPYKAARAGDVLDLGQGAGEGRIEAKVLNPSEPMIEKSALNNNSVVILLTYDKFSALLMGDAEKEAEEEILGRNKLQPVALLKVGHHGSNSSTSSKFLGVISPKIAVISVGKKNSFSHPHPSTLKKLEGTKTKIYRTDQNGTITIKTDGEKVFIL